MRLIFIYGAPASGKLTTAKELAKITNYKLYHNHLVYDLVASIFEYDKYKHIFFPLIEELHLFMISKAVKEKVPDLIMTNCYTHPGGQKFIRNLIDIVEKNNGEINFARITCSKGELMKRVSQKSRKKYGKLKDPQELETILKENNFFQEIPFVDSFSIDNTNVSAKKVASEIKKHFNL